VDIEELILKIVEACAQTPQNLVSEVMKRTGKSRSTVYRHIKNLVNNGDIECEPSEGGIYVYRRSTRSGARPQISGYFRPYRALLEKFVLLEAPSEEKLKEYLDNDLCGNCEQEVGEWPALRDLCVDCRRSLYTLLREKLISKVGSSNLLKIIPIYLYYEYKTELILIAYKALRDALRTLNPAEWWLLFQDYQKRLKDLPVRWIDPSLEPKLRDVWWYNPLLSTNTPEEAEKAIRVCMNHVRWKIIAQVSEDLKAQHVFRETSKELEEVFFPIKNKAYHNKNIFLRMYRQSRNPIYAKRIRQILEQDTSIA
jgi:DNA-binding Lrp family transcriptional regulator